MNKKEAAEKLVNGFSSIPTDWIKAVAEKTNDEFYGIMWGWMWIVNDSVDESRINKLLKPVEDEDDELYGNQEVASTGIYAFEIDGYLVLGINGAGYDFYESHWIPLYEALGYQWHEE
jgi:hypothetical protein